MNFQRRNGELLQYIAASGKRYMLCDLYAKADDKKMFELFDNKYKMFCDASGRCRSQDGNYISDLSVIEFGVTWRN